MSVTAITTYVVKCDYCFAAITGPSEALSDVVSLALKRAGHRYDPRHDAPGEVWECNECRARRKVREDMLSARAQYKA